ncbi:condensin complex subunit 2 isoform X3 [Passer montanus]|uniref:condensin complex subunit 2 isoform X3 n=1 Tax=Passer montanus TaxID=9160 RepID=UPI0019607ECF|nr:condensin complex subunit 2 isoform X3 [Passer montanus]
MAARSPRAAAAVPAAFLSPTPRAPGSTGTPVLAECPGNDDERERRQRRRSRVVDSSLQGLGSPSLRNESWQQPLPQWTNAQIAEHYSTCIKLSTENKITTKNAFGLHLIDYMTDILKQKNSEVTNFQVAAGTLDASAKIYAMRVDSVHADTFRVLGHLGKEAAPARDPGSPQEDSSPAPEAARKVQPKKKQSFKTIEQNLSNLNVPEGSRRAEVDPMFQRAVASFDECSSAGIFLTGLRSQGFQSRLLFPSEVVPLSSSESLALPSSHPLTVPDLKALLAPCLEKRRICSSLAGFQFTKWDEESHDEASTTLAKSILESQNRRNTTLPEDFNYDPQNLRQLFLKPLVKLSPSPDPVGALDSEAGIGDYDYNNPNDTSNFCPALQVPDSDDDPDPAEFPGQEGPFPLPAHPEAPEVPGINGNGPGCGELELIAEPHKIHKIPIQYARTAKRMDMRRLKRNMWELLTEQGEGEEAEEGTDAKVAGEKMLSDLIKDLQPRLPPTMATNLSVPLAFLCLLHLANEKNLKLESTEDLSDVWVRAGD